MRQEAEAAHREAEAARGREAAAAQQAGHCELRQPDGEEEVEAKSRGGVGGVTTTEAMRQPARKQEANGRGGVQEATRGEASADKRRRSAERIRGGWISTMMTGRTTMLATMAMAQQATTLTIMATATIMAMARRTATSMAIAMAQWATKSTMMATAQNCHRRQCAGVFAVIGIVLLPSL